jgi:hypothetical protein
MYGELNYDMTITCKVCKKDKNPKEFNLRIVSEKGAKAWADSCEGCQKKQNNRAKRIVGYEER